MLLDNLKRDLNEAILQFKAKEETLTPMGNQHIVELHQRIDAALSAVLLREDVMQYLTTTVPHRYFYFLPFVNDLRKLVERVFMRPEYGQNALMVADARINQQLNKANTDEIADLRRQLKSQTFTAIEALKRQINTQQQTINTLNLEVGTLRSSITTLQEDYNRSLNEIEQLKRDKSQLSTQNQNLMNRNLELEQRNRALEAELAGYRNMSSKRYSAQL